MIDLFHCYAILIAASILFSNSTAYYYVECIMFVSVEITTSYLLEKTPRIDTIRRDYSLVLTLIQIAMTLIYNLKEFLAQQPVLVAYP